MIRIKSSREHIEHVLFIFILTFPFFIYGFPSSVNNIFGFDITRGFFGERDPVGAGYVLVFGAPIYLYYFAKAILNQIGEAPTHMEISDQGIDILLPNFLSLKWSNLSIIHFKDINNERVLVFEVNDKIVSKTKLKFLDATEKKLANLLKKYAGEIVKQDEEKNS